MADDDEPGWVAVVIFAAALASLLGVLVYALSERWP